MDKTAGTDRLGFLLHDAARLMRRRFERRNAAYGLSAAQWRLLFRLNKEEGVSQVRLAEWLEIEPISVSRLLDRMEEGGWVERRQDVKDRRVRVIYPTNKAREVFSAVRSVALDVYEEALAGLDADARASLIATLVKINANLAECEECSNDAANTATDGQS